MPTDTFLSAGSSKNAGGATNVNVGGVVDSYSYSKVAASVAAAPTDVLVIAGSNARRVAVRRIVLSGIATTAGQMTVTLIRRQAAYTGGTSFSPNVRAREFSQQAPSATVTVYTANPTLPSGVGPIMESRLFLNLATAQPDRLVFDFTANGMKPLILVGPLDMLAVNFNGGAIPAGGSIDYHIEWTEE